MFLSKFYTYCVQFYTLRLVQARSNDFVKHIFRIFHSVNVPTKINTNHLHHVSCFYFVSQL